MRIEDSGLIYDAAGRPGSRRVASFVSLCPLRSGAVLCGFQLGSRKHDVHSTLGLCRSRDGGRTWEELPTRFDTTWAGVSGSLAAGEMVEVEAGRLLLFATWFDRRDPSRPLFDAESEGILPSRQLVAASTDEGQSWGTWQELPTPGRTGCSVTGPVLRWPDGRIGFAFESYKEYNDPRPARHAAWLAVSHDGGRSFDDPILVAQDPEHCVYYWDQRLDAEGSGGQFVALFWTHDRGRKQDLSVHLRRASIDANDIENCPVRATPIPGQIAAPLILPDGRLLAFVVNRGRLGTMTLWQSHDGGAEWPANDALVVYTHDERALISQKSTDIDFKQYWDDMAKWSFGHPAIRALDENRVLLAFYAGTPDCMSVHWARIDTREQ